MTNKRTTADYSWDIRRTFVEKRLRTPIVRKSGKVIKKAKVPITVHRLFLTGDFITTRAFRCVPISRSGVLSWSVSALTAPEKPLWAMPQLRPDPNAAPTWKRWASMSAAEFAHWLKKVLGPQRAMEALGEPKAAALFSDYFLVSRP